MLDIVEKDNMKHVISFRVDTDLYNQIIENEKELYKRNIKVNKGDILRAILKKHYTETKKAG